jgi:hypothetical protein
MIRLAILALLFLDFAALNVYVLSAVGFVGFWQAILASPAGIMAVVDLSIAIGLILAWMWSDSRERRLPFAPYAALALALGSLGPLAYLIHRELRALRAVRAVSARRATA